MRQLLRLCCLLAAVVTTVTAAEGAQKAKVVSAGSGPLATGVLFVPQSSVEENRIQLEHIRAAGARYVRINLYWSSVAPAAPSPEFQPRNPADVNYRWQRIDDAVLAAAEAGLEPIVLIFSSPSWANEPAPTSNEPGAQYKPSPTALADFATAVATRYSGDFETLPRVRYWSIWCEPNLSAYLNPQSLNGKAFAPSWYRSMLNAAADALHAVSVDNVVIGGETAPFWSAELPKTRPIEFMKEVLCISEKRVRNKKTKKIQTIFKSACQQRAHFDVWAHHPYTEGGPTKRARVRGNASLGDLGDMRAALNAAIRMKHVVSSRKVGFWVTEFSWESNPPDPGGVPSQLEARWVSEALYHSWRAGVTLFVWFQIRDDPVSRRVAQSGLWYRGDTGIESDRPKPALRAFRFPFVALRQPKNKVQIWGRTLESSGATVLIERKAGRYWKRIKILRANRYGIFSARLREPAKTTYVRARLADGSDWSVPFSLTPPKKTWAGCVWGAPCTFTVG